MTTVTRIGSPRAAHHGPTGPVRANGSAAPPRKLGFELGHARQGDLLGCALGFFGCLLRLRRRQHQIRSGPVPRQPQGQPESRVGYDAPVQAQGVAPRELRIVRVAFHHVAVDQIPDPEGYALLGVEARELRDAGLAVASQYKNWSEAMSACPPSSRSTLSHSLVRSNRWSLLSGTRSSTGK